jgi:predicted nuclease of predicted toxin-antitoxin system
MQFLADESCDFAVVRALCQGGHDVLAVAEVAPRAADEDVLQMALAGKRILLTEDKDFGQWVWAEKRASGGVILLRYPATSRKTIPDAVMRLVDRYGERLLGCFVVMQPGRVRISRPAAT